MEMTVSQLVYYCNRSVALYTSAIKLAEKANLIDIFSCLKKRRLRLLRLISRHTAPDTSRLPIVESDNLTDLLSEIKSNEEQLIEVSTRILKNKRVKSSRFKDFIGSSVSEISSSLHWLDILSSYYKKRKCG